MDRAAPASHEGISVSSIQGTVALDLTFATGGIRFVNVPGGSQVSAAAMTLDTQGRIYLAGCYPAPGRQFWLARFGADGEPDTGFGHKGMVIDTFAPAQESVATAVTLTRAGDILVTGVTRHGKGLALYDTTGQPKAGFGADAKVVLGPPDTAGNSIDFACALASLGSNTTSSLELADGRLLVIANYLAAHSSGMIYRLNADGSLDTTLGGKGYLFVRHPIHQGASTLIEQLLVQPDGKWLGLGTLTRPSGKESMFFRLHGDGSADHTFGSAGFVLVKRPMPAHTQLLQHTDGRIVGVGSDYIGAFVGLLLGHEANGMADTGFNNGTPLQPRLNEEPTMFNAARLDAQGRIVVAGAIIKPATGMGTLSVARYLETGELDLSFNHQGWLQLQIGADENLAQTLLVQPDGNLLVAGSSADGGFVLRLTGSPEAAL